MGTCTLRQQWDQIILLNFLLGRTAGIRKITWTYSNTFKWHVIYFLFRNDTKRFCMFSIIQVIFTHTLQLFFSYQQKNVFTVTITIKKMFFHIHTSSSINYNNEYAIMNIQTAIPFYCITLIFLAAAVATSLCPAHDITN